MKPEVTKVSVELAGGKQLSIETGKLAKQAHGAAVVRFGDNVVLATATSNPEPREGIDFFPLTVDYREYTYAGGRIPGGFIKREGRMSEREVLTSRQIDRPVRPMFADGFKCETQVIAFVLSADTENDPDVCGINAASAALTISDIPFLGPLGAVRVGLIDGRFIANPTYTEMREGLLNIMVVGTADAIVMIESGAKEVKEETVVDAIEFAHTEIKKICAAINELRGKVGKPKRQVTPPEFDETYFKGLESRIGRRLSDALDTAKHPKSESYELVRTLEKELLAAVPEDDAAGKTKVKKYYEILRERIFRDQVIANKHRPDGRAFDQIREIWIEAGVHPRRNPGVGHHHARHQRRYAASRGLRRRSQKTLHAALQFPAVFRGRSRFHARRWPSRNRTRSARRARGFGCASRRRQLAICHARRLRYSGVERIVVDGHDLRRFTLVDGCGRAFESSGSWRSDGIGERGRPIRHSDRHRGSGRSLRRHGFQSCRNQRWNHRAADGY
jgi:ribonuclease PH